MRRARGPSVLVLGAGFAGLAAALRLSGRGAHVTLLDREAAPGGRARAVGLAGAEVDPCATLLSTRDAALRTLLAELGQPDELEAWPASAMRRTDASDALLPLESGRPGIWHPPAGIGRREAARTVRLERLALRYARRFDREAPESAGALDDRSVAEWTRLYFGPGVLDAWIAPWLAAATLGDVEETSRVLFLRHASGLGADAAPASLRAGPGPLAEAVARRVPSRFGLAIESIERAGDAGFEVAGRESPGGGALGRVAAGREGGGALRLAADALVLALPPADALAVAASVLSSAERDSLSGVSFRPALSVAFSTRNGAPSPARRIVCLAPERALRALQFQGAPAPRASECLVVVASERFAREQRDGADEAVVRRLTAEAERFAPRHLREIQEARVVRWDAALPAFGVGGYRRVASLRRAEAQGLAAGRRLVFAGDHLVGPRLEDAIASGFRAADTLASALGLASSAERRAAR